MSMPTTTQSTATEFVELGNKKIQVTIGGAGPPLVYLHSAGGETDWMPFHAALAERFQVVAPAAPGFSLSSGLDEIDNMVDLAWHTIDLLAKLKLNHVPVVGFSIGGWLAAQMAILRPALISKLVLVNAAGLRLADAPMGELFIDDLDDLRALLFHDPNDPSIELAMPSSLEDPRILNWLRAREATARLGWNPYLHDPKVPDHLQRIQCPTLVICGKQDKLIPLAHGEFYARHIPNTRLEVLDACGHMLPFERSEDFANLVTQFCK
jgi:pimeloyl-ACP methyl ester carboxylesterase